jgi:hypothetical protein
VARSPDWEELHNRFLNLPRDGSARHDSSRLVAPAPAVPALGTLTTHRRLLRSAKGIRKLMSSEHAVMNFMEREEQLRMWLGGVPFVLQWALRPPNQAAYPLLADQVDRAWIDNTADVWCEHALEPIPEVQASRSDWLRANVSHTVSSGVHDSNSTDESHSPFAGSTTGRGGAGASW